MAQRKKTGGRPPAKPTTEEPAAGKPGSKAGRSVTVRQIREALGRTQAELARALGISEKAIQSYEQGWRDVPVRVVIQLLVLLALYRKQSIDDIPCWELRKCPPEQREKCASFTVGRGQFCWFVGNSDCRPKEADDLDAILPCMSCPVVQRILKGRLPDSDAPPKT
jgi:DNA-binding XRE family transcriptional regulator